MRAGSITMGVGVGVEAKNASNPGQSAIETHWKTGLSKASVCKRCGAKTRSGKPCQTAAMTNGRCRMHGGTNPRRTVRTAERKLPAWAVYEGSHGAAALFPQVDCGGEGVCWR